MAAYIDVQNLSYSYPDGTLALRKVNLRVNNGDFLALIGQNGSGKTTLSKCLNGILKPTDGTVLVDGFDTSTASVAEMVRRVGYVFQNPDHQIFNSNVYDEIAYGPRNIGLREAEVKDRVIEATRVVGLKDEHLSVHPFFLPKGLRQRVAIASILALRPKVIIVDEPTTGQDMYQSFEIMNFLTELHEKNGHIIIIVTHDMPIVARYAKRVVVMAMGQIIMDGPTAEVFSHPEELSKSFVKPPQITRLGQSLLTYGFPPNILRVEEMAAVVKEKMVFTP
ncbi:energy-coupling factor transporter ATP-binding protein EcfA2 [Moorella thermoacetica]|uniref:Energy-coupling factor transporter ATP-binding protein EcfA2 n=1 Tax=Neomoorella thermoacetica TaxID=1525 RepID=A0A1J5NZ62_NEOTH|nr:energy-coupling factor transporter ATP-binding protein EcfA2 [Moorella thermoacetica]